MSRVSELLDSLLASGELDRLLHVKHARWRRILEEDDFKQRVLVRALESQDHFRGTSDAEFLGWLSAIGTRIALDEWRNAKRRRSVLDRLRDVWSHSRPYRAQVGLETFAEWLLAGLTERERKLLRLRYYQDRSTVEIANALGTSRAGVYQLQFRALAKLRDRALKRKDRQ
jgi:RNA polymerase sigma factor (sigma-70 family)